MKVNVPCVANRAPSNAYVILLSPQGTINSYGKNFFTDFEFSVTPPSKIEFAAFFQDPSQAIQLLQKAIDSGSADYQGVLVTGKNSEVQASLDISCLYTDGNLPDGFSVSIHLKENERETKPENKSLLEDNVFRALLENSHDTVSLLNAEGKIIYVSPSITKINGYSPEEAIGIPVGDFIHEDDLPTLLHQIEQAKALPDTPIYGINRLKHKEGHFVWTEGTATNMLLDEHVRAIVSNFRAISERKLIEENLKNSEQRFRALVENSHDGISIVDSTGAFTYISSSVFNIMGYTPDGLIGKNPAEFVHPGDIGHIIAVLTELMQQPRCTTTSNYRMLHKDGSWRWLKSNITNLLHEPAVNGLVFNYNDITEIVQAEQKIKIANRLYSFISLVNKTIVHAQTAEEVFSRVCKIAVEVGKFKLGWVGLVSKNYNLITFGGGYGIPPEELYRFRSFPYAANGPTAEILRTGKPWFTNNIKEDFKAQSWHDLIDKLDLGSNIALPIFCTGEIVGTLHLFAAEMGYFDEKEIDLLTEVSEDISFALDVFEAKRRREQMVEKVVHSESMLKKAQSIAQLGSWELNFATGILEFSEEACTIFGVENSNHGRTFEYWVQLLHPDDRERVLSERKISHDTFSSFSTNHRIIRPEGSIRHIHTQSQFEFDKSGKPIRTFGIVHDITEIKEAEQKIAEVNRLYSFISQINKTILRASDEETVFIEACRIAIETGEFIMAWIAKIDVEHKSVNYIAGYGVPEKDIPSFQNAAFDDKGPQAFILNNGTPFICNDIYGQFELKHWKGYATANGIGSIMVLPLRKSGEIICSLNMYAAEKDFFDEQKIDLLEAVAEDISFAMGVFEKERHRKQIEEQLINRDERLNHAQSVAHLGSWEYDSDNDLLICSAEYCNIYGLPAEENVFAPEFGYSFVHPDDLEYTMAVINESRQKIIDTAVNFRIIRRDGAIRHIYAQTNFEFDKAKNLKRISGIIHDVTAQKEAEAKIISANRLYSFISQINKTIVQVHDEDTLFHEASRIAIETGKFQIAWIGLYDHTDATVTYAQGCGLPHQDMPLFQRYKYNKEGFMASVARDGEVVVCNDLENESRGPVLKEYAERNGLHSYVALPVKKSGKVIGVFNIYCAERNFFDDQETALMQEVAGDISFALDAFEKERHRRRMEEKIRHSELLLKQAQAIAHFGSWELDLSTGIAEWAEETCRIYGIDPMNNMVPPDEWLSYLHPEDLENILNTRKTAYLKKTGSEYHHRIIRKNGEIRHIYSQSELELDATGKPIKIHGVAHDITSQKNAEAERSKMMEDILQRNKNLEQFSYIVSHNLRAPVANIMGISEVLRLPNIGREREKDLMSSLAVSVKKLDDVIMDLNYILQIKNKGINKVELVSFSGILHDVETSIENIILNEGVEIVSDFTAVDEIKTFKSYLNSIFYNLISNSIKYRRVDIKPIINVTSQRDQSKIILSFKDNGLGIDLNRKSEYVFGLYKRFHDHVEGKGMGLYMVKTQVESLGGRIEIFSEVNQGTEFKIEFDAIF